MHLIHLLSASRRSCSFLAHTSDINDLLEGLDGVLEDWLDGLHDTESSLHIVDLWLHALDGLHLSGNLNEWLSIIESLEDSGGEGLLDVLDSEYKESMRVAEKWHGMLKVLIHQADEEVKVGGRGRLGEADRLGEGNAGEIGRLEE